MTKQSSIRLNLYLWIFISTWIGCVTASLWWNIDHVGKSTLEVARASARVAYEKDIVYRRWNTKNGGVYVPVTEKVKPNPFLNVSERDITTPSGKILTLMNPAYMTREVHELTLSAYGVKGHITSLNPIRPQNYPDPWETLALEAFQHGKQEVCSLEKISGKDYFRLMKPLITENGCLKCHAVQGYKEGDIRGGISVSIPMAPLWEIEKSSLIKLTITHVLLMVLGLMGIGISGSRLRNQMNMRERAELALIQHGEDLEEIVKQRTLELENLNQQLTLEIEERGLIQKEQELLQLRLKSFWKIARMVNTDFKTLCAQILSEMTAMTQSKYGLYGILSEDENMIYNFSWSTDVRKDCNISDQPAECHPSDLGLLGDAIHKRKSVIINNYKENHPAKKGFPEGHIPIRNILIVPIFLQGRIIKLAAVANKPVDYTKEDAKQIDAFVTGIQIILERQRAEEALIKSEERYRELVENTEDMIIRCDSKGNFTYLNHMSEKFFGMPLEECLGLNAMDFIHPDDKGRVTALVLKTIKNREHGLKFENRQISKSGEVRDVFWTANIYYDDQGRFRGNGAIGRDVTEYKKMQEELTKIKKLEATGIFAGGIAHDFNNLLYIILGNINLIKESSASIEACLPMLAQAETAVLRAKDLTQKFITFSSGGDPVKSTIVINELIEEVRDIVLSGTNIQSDYDLCRHLMPVEVDTGQIRQVLINVIENAKDAMPDGGFLKISTENTTSDIENKKYGLSMKQGQYIKLLISDNGIGIFQKHIEQIFDPYFSTKHRGHEKGMGLGLSIVHSIVKKHNGYIHVESELKKGTVFLIYLPTSEKQSIQENITEQVYTGKIKRILVMDDEEQIRILSKKILNRLGYDVELASNGQEAVAQYKNALGSSQPFDLVILDLTIKGGMGGVETIKQLLKIDPDVRAIIVSGYSADPIMSNYRDHGFVSSMTKPISISQLKQKLDNLYKGEEG